MKPIKNLIIQCSHCTKSNVTMHKTNLPIHSLCNEHFDNEGNTKMQAAPTVPRADPKYDSCEKRTCLPEFERFVNTDPTLCEYKRD